MNVSRENLLARPDIQAMRTRQLEQEDERREFNFAVRNLDDFAVRNLDDDRESQDFDLHQKRLNDFISAKKSLGSMSTRFALSMEPGYSNMTIAEIGATTDAQCPNAIDALKDDYRTLLESLKTQEIVEDEFPRESKLACRALSIVAPDDQYVVLARTRLLTSGCTEERQNFALGKRMVFALPNGAWMAVQARSQKMGEPQIDIVEQMLDQNDQYVIPIRTAYYRLRDLNAE